LKWRGAKPQTPSAEKKLSSPPRQDAELITETEVVKNNESISKTLSLSDQKVSKPGMYKIELFQKPNEKNFLEIIMGKHLLFCSVEFSLDTKPNGGKRDCERQSFYYKPLNSGVFF